MLDKETVLLWLIKLDYMAYFCTSQYGTGPGAMEASGLKAIACLNPAEGFSNSSN